MKKPKASSVSLVFSAFASTGLVLGCYATAGTAPPERQVVQVQPDDNIVYVEAPPRVETYPVVVYEGTPHYYYEGRWYHRRANGWGYYKREPAHLSQHRPPEHRDERHEGRHDDRR